MTKSFGPLSNTDPAYFKFPKSIYRGWTKRYPLEIGLTDEEFRYRKQWLADVKKRSHSKFHRMVCNYFTEPSDGEEMRSILARHGLFVELFFKQSISERITRRVADPSFDLHKFQKAYSKAFKGENCNINEKRVDGYFKNKNQFPGISKAQIRETIDRGLAIKCVGNHIYEQTLVQAISQRQIRQKLERWFEEFRKFRICAICGNKFRLIDLHNWSYFSSNGIAVCCFRCPIMATPTKTELFDLVPIFVKTCGFIPNSQASPFNYAFTSRILAEQWLDITPIYAKMGGIYHVKKKFGSWFKAMAETGALPDKVQVTGRGIRCLAKDGHECHSLDEQYIDDWLFAHRIPHEREPNYPIHPTLNPSGRKRADWKVGNTFIEYFGLVGDSNYEKRMNEKIFLAQQYKIDLIAIYPANLASLNQRLGHLLNN